jgi:hypothetical protein
VRVDALAFVDGWVRAGPGPALTRMGIAVARHPARDASSRPGRGETRGHWLNVEMWRPRGGVCRSGALLDSAQAGRIGDRLRVDLDPADGDWVMLRVSDPGEPVDPSATGEHARPDRRIASTSPCRWTRLPGP